MLCGCDKEKWEKKCTLMWSTWYSACHIVTTVANNLLSVLLRWSQIFILGLTFTLTFLSARYISPPRCAAATSSSVRSKLNASDPDPSLVSPLPASCFPSAPNLCDSFNFSFSHAALCQVLQIHHPQQLTRILSFPSPWPCVVFKSSLPLECLNCLLINLPPSSLSFLC